MRQIEVKAFKKVQEVVKQLSDISNDNSASVKKALPPVKFDKK